MLSAIFSSIGGAFISHFFDAAKDIFHDYQQGKITAEECKTRLLSAALDSFRAVEVSHAETLAKTYQTFWTAADSDKTNLMKIMWAATLASQVWVLFWAQFVAPLLYAYGFMDKGWHAGGTVEWAYALVGGLLGFGPMVLRTGPASGGIMDQIKALVKK